MAVSVGVVFSLIYFFFVCGVSVKELSCLVRPGFSKYNSAHVLGSVEGGGFYITINKHLQLN